MKALFICLLVALLVLQEAFCQNGEALRRRRIRKKVIKQVIPEGLEDAQALLPEEFEQSPQSLSSDEEDRYARGFLDDYYAQFDDRISHSQVDRVGGAAASGNARIDPYGNAASAEAVEGKGRNMADYSAFQQLQQEALRHKQMELEAALKQKYFEEELLEEELKSLQDQPKTVQQSQPELRSGTRYVQHVALPTNTPDETAYMYSSVMANDMNENEILPAKSMSNYVYAKPDPMTAAENAAYYTSSAFSNSESEDEISRLFTGDSSSSSAYSGYDFSPSSSSSGTSGKDPVSRFFGITGTTSQDIQLGLTFTVPFLSVPLTSLQSMLGGGGLGDLFDNFSFDSGSLITIAVIAMAAIFVLPQMIYWLTGVNLSAFNWGRMDDGHGLDGVSVINMIDESLKKYDIDTRTCMARTMCNQYAKRMVEGEEEAVQRISRGLIENIANHDYVKKYVGESKVQEALRNGENGKDCSIYYTKDVCPWDSTAMLKIVSKVMTSGNIDFASIASAAAANYLSS